MNVVYEDILIQLDTEESTSGGIMLPDQEEVRTGTVIAEGNEVPIFLELIGKKVKHKQFFDGEKFEHEGKSFIVVNYKNILIIY